jgi:hypothetical protein
MLEQWGLHGVSRYGTVLLAIKSLIGLVMFVLLISSAFGGHVPQTRKHDFPHFFAAIAWFLLGLLALKWIWRYDRQLHLSAGQCEVVASKKLQAEVNRLRLKQPI